MTPEQVLSNKPLVLTQAQREFYFEQGYLVLEDLTPQHWLDRLRAVTAEFVEKSRSVLKSNKEFDLEPNHTPQDPRIRRLIAPVDRHPTYWEWASDSVITDVAADLVGPDVKFHSCKLNFKWSKGGEEVKWHQDIQYWPHTNYSPLTIGIYLDDVGPDQGPLAIIPGSHNGPLYELYDEDRVWTGCLKPEDMAQVDDNKKVEMTGKAGTLTIINCRTLHGSAKNEAAAGRPLLLNIFSAADAFAYTAMPTPTSHTGEIVRGKAARWAHLDPRPCPVPPQWDKTGYGSIFAVQQKEVRAKAS